MRTPIVAGLALALNAILAAPEARAQDITTRSLKGRYLVEVTSSTARRTFGPEAEVEVSRDQEIRLLLDGHRVLLVRRRGSLYGLLPATGGLRGRLAGERALPRATIKLRIHRNELVGTVQSPREHTRLALRRTPALDAALVEAARRYVMANAGDDLAFPGVASGEDGLHAYALAGAGAARLVAFTKAWFGDDGEVAAYRHDPTRRAIVAVRTTFDEHGLFVVVLDLATGTGRLLGDQLHVVDASDRLDQPTLDRLLPGMGPVDEVDHLDLIDRLVDGGVEVELTAEFFALRHWGAPATPVRFFRDASDWRAVRGRWAYLQDDEEDHATFVLGRDDQRVEVVKVTRATGAVEVVGEP